MLAIKRTHLFSFAPLKCTTTWVTAALISLILVPEEPQYRDAALAPHPPAPPRALGEDARTFPTCSLAISQHSPPSLLHSLGVTVTLNHPLEQKSRVLWAKKVFHPQLYPAESVAGTSQPLLRVGGWQPRFRTWSTGPPCQGDQEPTPGPFSCSLVLLISFQ